MEIKGEQKTEHAKKVEKERESIKKVIIWNDETIELLKKNTTKFCSELEEKIEDNVETRWRDIKEIVEKSWTKEVRKVKRKNLDIKYGGIETVQD